MKDLPKRLALITMWVAGFVALLALMDLVIKIPFSGTEHSQPMDIMYLISSAIVGYLGWDAFRELR